MKKSILWKEAGVLLIAAFLVFSMVTVTANTEKKVVASEAILVSDIRPIGGDEVLWDDFEDGDYTNNPTWTMESYGNGDGSEDWEIKDDPWTYAWGTVTHHGSGYFMGSDSDAGGAIADEYMVIDFDTPGTGAMTLVYWLHFRSFFDPDNEYFEVLIDDVQVDHISIPGSNPPPFEGDREVDISAYNDGGTHTLKMHYYADWGYVAAFDDVHIFTGEPPAPDLDCDGELSWEEITPGDTVTGDFEVSNVGDAPLDWEIESFPDWGNWTFDPESGIDLGPGGAVTVDVECIAPDEENGEFEGEIVLVNSDDPDDTCTIPVTLKTPVVSPFVQLLQIIMQRFPILGQIIYLFL